MKNIIYMYMHLCAALIENYNSRLLIFQELCSVGADTNGAVWGLSVTAVVVIYFPIIRLIRNGL